MECDFELPCVFDYLSKFEPAPWLIVGKGPSFSTNKIMDFKYAGYKLCSLNNAFMGSTITFDMIISNDVLSLTDTYQYVHYPTIVAVPSGIHSQHLDRVNYWPKIHQLSITLYYLRRYIYGFDITNLGCNHYKNHTIKVHHSTCESAIQILALSGVKTLEFNGVDGGSEYHPLFEKNRISQPVDMSNQFGPIINLRNRFPNVTFSGLPKGLWLNSNEDIQ